MQDINQNKDNINITPQVNNPLSAPSEMLTKTPPAALPLAVPPKRPRKKKFIFISIFVLLVIFVVSGSMSYYTMSRGKTQTAQTMLSPTTTTDMPSVEYIKREKYLDSVKLNHGTDVEATSGDDLEDDIYDFYKVGTVTSGKYKDGDLLLVLVTAGGPCKGLSCHKPSRLRYVKKDNSVAFLTKISYPPILEEIAKINPFKKFGFSLVVDNDFTLPILEYPKEIQGNTRQVLKLPEYLMEEDGELDTTKLYKASSHSVLGDIYTTKAEVSSNISFGSEELSLGSSFLENCEGSGCFTTNQFFVFRPDGTYLKFGYNPDFKVEDITWTDNKKAGGEYVSYTVVGCSNLTLDDHSVVDPSLVADSDIEIIGKTNTGEDILGLKDKKHKLNTEFYDTYKKYYAGPYIYPEEKRQTKSFSDFINSRPIFLWRDPFDRLIRFNNNEFLPPFVCEPIIYLYPQVTQKVSITFDKIVHLSDSTPQYRNGWNVIADPTGKIQNPSDNRTYPYLFWEGWSRIFPIQSKGFVVKQSEISSFLSKILPRLGLNEKEKNDFMRVWMPYFSDSSYYFITFLDQSAIDRIAPLNISPKPDTLIRVLMDTKPLDYPIVVKEPELGSAPERSGFTVVEWGGLKR
jgi:hypothetical protein